MNLKKHWAKHFVTLVILVIFGFLASGSLDDTKDGMKAYKSGNYQKAKKIWSNSSDLSYLSKPEEIEACWYLGELYQQDGDEENALKYKVRAYNAAVDSFTSREFQEKDSELYSTMCSDSLILQAIRRQQAEKYVGTWTLQYTHHNGQSYSTSNLRTYPKSVVLNENGTGTIYFVNAKNNDFSWSVSNGQLILTGTNFNFGMNSQGFIYLTCPVIKQNLGITYADFLFKK